MLTPLAPLVDLDVQGLLSRDLGHYVQRSKGRAQRISLGRTHEGRPIEALVVGAGKGKPALLLTGAHHGGEVFSIVYVLDAIEQVLFDQRSALYSERFAIYFIPVVNPDGVAAGIRRSVRSSRKNGRDNNHNGVVERVDGVDINRNYPIRFGQMTSGRSSADPESPWYRGPAPASEPETRAVIELAERSKPVAALSFHMGTEALLAPYTIPGLKNPEPNEALVVARYVADGLPLPFVPKERLYPVDGTEQDHLRFAHGTVALLLEGGRDTPKSAAGRAEALLRIRPAWQRLLDRFDRGPSVHGVVRNEKGHPVKALVTLLPSLQHEGTREGEKWATRADDGHFARYLPAQGRYVLQVQNVQNLSAPTSICPPVQISFATNPSAPTRLDVDLPPCPGRFFGGGLK